MSQGDQLGIRFRPGFRDPCHGRARPPFFNAIPRICWSVASLHSNERPRRRDPVRVSGFAPTSHHASASLRIQGRPVPREDLSVARRSRGRLDLATAPDYRHLSAQQTSSGCLGSPTVRVPLGRRQIAVLAFISGSLIVATKRSPTSGTPVPSSNPSSPRSGSIAAIPIHRAAELAVAQPRRPSTHRRSFAVWSRKTRAPTSSFWTSAIQTRAGSRPDLAQHQTN